MSSIKQIIAEIQLAADLPPSHKAKAVQIIRDAEERLKLKAPAAPRKITNARNLMTIEEWEQIHSPDPYHRLFNWIRNSQLCPKVVGNMLEEFRVEMRAKGKQYANFRMAFQTYLTKGYLSKKITECTLENSPFKHGTVVHTKGVNL